MSSVKVHALGCRLNAYEAEVIRQKAEAKGLDDLVVVNSCAVTNEAVRQTRQLVRKLRRENPSSKLILTGCAVETDGEALSSLVELDGLLGNRDKLDPQAYQDLIKMSARNENVDDKPLPMIRRVLDGHDASDGFELNRFQTKSRASVQIQGGCDHRCTFCVIPFGRGPSRSRPIEAVLASIKALVNAGYDEVTLTGVDITDYGLDLPEAPRLGTLVLCILETFPNLKRLRLSSLDPAEIDEGLLQALTTEERLMPHIHLSMQAGADLILKRMKRRHRAKHIDRLCETLTKARPDFSFGADIIAGFPTETDDHFDDSVALVKRWNMTHLHVFPYSAREGTPAARMPQVDKQIIKARAKVLRDLGAQQLHNRLCHETNKEVDVLFETNQRGRTPNNFIVTSEQPISEGTMRRMWLTVAKQDQLSGHLV